MSKSHTLFLRHNPEINRGKLVKELIEEENLNINEKAFKGNTILHFMAMNVYKNYYNPFFSKRPRDKSKPLINENLYYYGSTYTGPAFFDDLEIFLSLGANPTLKNINNQTAFKILIEVARPYFRLEECNKYLKLLLKYYPHSEAIIEIIKETAWMTSPKFKNEQLKKYRVAIVGSTWINTELPVLLDEKLLSLECLSNLINWINNGELVELGATVAVAEELKQRFTRQVQLLKETPFLNRVISKFLAAYELDKEIILRAILQNDSKYPLLNLIDQLIQFPLVELLNQSLFNAFNSFLNEYKEYRKICEKLKAYLLPLDEAEKAVVKPIVQDINDALSENIYSVAKKSFNKSRKNNEDRYEMIERLSLFNHCSYAKFANVINELKLKRS